MGLFSRKRSKVVGHVSGPWRSDWLASFAIALRTIVSRSAGIAGLMRRGARGSSTAICRSSSLPVGASKRGLQRQQFVQRGPERIDVGAVVEHDARAERLLRAHVAERAEQVAGHRQVGAGLELRPGRSR